MKTLIAIILLATTLLTGVPTRADTPRTRDGITTIHLDQYNGYFAARETLAGLKPGRYEFVVSNKAGKVVGFQVQDNITRETLDMFPLDPGQVKRTVVEVSSNGFRYRCPINPTPWYEVDTRAGDR